MSQHTDGFTSAKVKKIMYDRAVENLVDAPKTDVQRDDEEKQEEMMKI